MDPTADSLVIPATDLKVSSSHSLSSANGTGEKHKGKNKAGKNKKNQTEYDFGDRVRIRMTGYWASFMLTGVMMPIVSSAILVTLYFSFPDFVKHILLIIGL